LNLPILSKSFVCHTMQRGTKATTPTSDLENGSASKLGSKDKRKPLLVRPWSPTFWQLRYRRNPARFVLCSLLAVACLVHLLVPPSGGGAASVVTSGHKMTRPRVDRELFSFPDPNAPLEIDPGTILVTLASYRDYECHRSLISAFEKAKNPDLIYFGVFEQHDPSDKPCLFFEEVCGDQQYDENVSIIGGPDPQLVGKRSANAPKHPICSRMHQIKVRRLHFMEGAGPTHGRHHSELMLERQEFHMQIDSHSQFVQNWDEVVKQSWRATQNEYAVLSTYPKATGTSGGKHVPVICRTDFQPSFHFMLKHNASRLMLMPDPSKPMLVPFWAAGFSFSKAHRVRRVPYDGYTPMLFDGEEYGIGARMWTHGYDFYAPNNDVVYHLYSDGKERRKRVKYWEIEWGKRYQIQRKSAARIRAMFDDIPIAGVEIDRQDLEKYSLGSVRPIEAYYKFSGVDMKHHKSIDLCAKALKGDFHRVPWTDTANDPVLGNKK